MSPFSSPGVELWHSDGTLARTMLVQDIFPGLASSFLTGLTNVNGAPFFAADDGTTGSDFPLDLGFFVQYREVPFLAFLAAQSPGTHQPS